MPALERVYSAAVEVGAVDDYGVTRAGHRRVVQILGGELEAADPRLAHLQDGLLIASAARDARLVRYDCYRVL